MPQYEVDVKAFINVTVRADSPEDARIVADAFVENGLWASPEGVRSYNEGTDNPIGVVVPKEYEPAVDGDSVVEEDEYAEIWENHYECDGCGTRWTDRWACQVDDECPKCGSDTSPHTSEEIGL